MSYSKFFPDTMSLETPRATLRIMQPGDIPAFRQLAIYPETFKYFTRDLSVPDDFDLWIEEAFQARSSGTRVPFTVFDTGTGEVCGSTSLGNISFYDKRAEIGWSWLAPQFQGTGINRQAKFALLSYAFDVLKFERVEVKTDVLNGRARAALKKIGMVEEGILRSHTLMHSNRRRDTIYYSILRSEWPAKRETYFQNI
ncbi:MAG TPA: GNAT family protein [Flavitalea sp.]|nr:GNAT family protein [Flavitalea sp.]